MGELFQPMHLILIVFVMSFFSIIPVVCFWLILKKAGFSPILALLMLVPGIQWVVLIWFAVTDWPALKKGN